jgi:hypothetical protein
VVVRMKIELASDGVIVGSDGVATSISIVERIAHLNLTMDNRHAAVNYLNWVYEAGVRRR